MKFVNPGFLFALFAIAIPIIIHLFNFRKYKRVYFTNVKFLKEVQQETQSQSKLRHLLVLLSRILAVSFLVFAFAQPYLPVNNSNISTGDKAVSIYIDNSFSMDALHKSGNLLEEAKKRALEIVSAYKATDRFQLLSNDFEGRHQRLVNKEEFTELLSELKISSSVKTLPEILSRQFDVLSNSKNKKAYIISDFQKSISDFERINNDTSVKVSFIPLAAQEKGNVFIDSCWFSTPVRQLNQTEQLHVRIRNTSKNTIENNPVKLFINGQQRSIASYTIEPESQVEEVLSFASNETGIQNCRVEITDYPVTFDDVFYLSFDVAGQIPVLSINTSNKGITSSARQSNSYLYSLFGKDSLFIFHNSDENKLDYSSLANNKLIVLNELQTISSGLAQELKRFVSNGGSLLVFPAATIDINSYQDFLLSVKANYYENIDTANTKVDKINEEHEIFKDVFEKKVENINLPSVNKHYQISKNIHSNGEYLLKLLNGDVFFSKYSFEKGKIYLSSVPLNTEFSNFQKHALFVPLMFKIAIYSQKVKPLFYTIGKDDELETDNKNVGAENVFHIKKSTENFDIIPEHKVSETNTTIFIHNQISEAGNYNLEEGQETVSGLAFNYDRKESDLHCYTSEEISKEIRDIPNFSLLQPDNKSLAQSITEATQGKKLWKLCIILALAFLGIEVLLLRFWKR